MHRYTHFFNPLWWLSFLHRTRYAHFFIVGATGVLINLAITALFAELVFGREQYFTGYLIGLAANLLYNFGLHTVVTFKTKDRHITRLAIFLAYSLAMSYIQALVVKWLTDLVGVDWYLVVIASVILAFSVVTFVLFKFLLFKTPRTPEAAA
jgi:putative flippase GtrA